jgi:hypothetical protein
MQRPVRVLESDSSTRGRRIPVRGLQGREINSRHSPSPAADPSATGHDANSRSASSAAVLNCASLYCQKPDGVMPWAERPEPLKQGIIARIPNFE